MTSPAPDFILGWTAAIEAAAQISGQWGSADGPNVDPEAADNLTGYEAGWVDGKLHAQSAIRAIAADPEAVRRIAEGRDE